MSTERLSASGAWQGALVGTLVAVVPVMAFVISDVSFLWTPVDVAVFLAVGGVLMLVAAVVGTAVGAAIGFALGAAAGVALDLTARQARRPSRTAAAVAAAALVAAVLAMAVAGGWGVLLGSVGDPRRWFMVWTYVVVLAGPLLVLAVVRETRVGPREASA